MLKRIHIWVEGTVQGVFFRHNTAKLAKELSVRGWVRNRANNRVEIIGEGEEDDLRNLLDWCRRGPIGARVERVEIEWEAPSDEFKEFSIAY